MGGVGNKIDFQNEAWYKAAYVANDKKECGEFIDMVVAGQDKKKKEKLPYRRFMQQGFDGRACERIAEFVDRSLGEILIKGDV